MSTQSVSTQQTKKESEQVTQQTMTEPKFTVGQHVHVETPLVQRVGVVGEIFVADPVTQLEHVYRITANEGDTMYVIESQLSSCDLVEQLRADVQRIREQNDDHGPGCDGPLNCTCSDGDDCERKVNEQAAVNDTLRSVISALQRAAADLQSFEIDEYADLDIIADSAALDEIGNAAAALIGIVAVMCDSHPADGNWDDQGHCSAVQLRSGHAVSVVR